MSFIHLFVLSYYFMNTVAVYVTYFISDAYSYHKYVIVYYLFDFETTFEWKIVVLL